MNHTSQVPSHPIAAAFFASTRKHFDLPGDPDERLEQLTKLRAEWKQLYATLSSAAGLRDPEVWTALGHGAQHGWGTERNLALAESWFRTAADSGHAPAMVRLALILSHPERAAADRPEALALLRRAADLGNSSAMVQLGFAYREGHGVDSDYHAAIDWFIKAHEAGAEYAAMHVGRTYAIHLNSPTNALLWLHLAAKYATGDSYIFLAMLHDERSSELYDPAEAVKWYQTVVARNGGSKHRALLELGQHYRDGIGVPKCPEIAKIWLQMLASDVSRNSEFRDEGMKLLEEMGRAFSL